MPETMEKTITRNRPCGCNRYGETTKQLRIPLSLVPTVELLLDLKAQAYAGDPAKVLRSAADEFAKKRR